MKTTYLKEFVNYSARKIAFIPVGTLEWHGNHLPIETDFLVAQKICEILNKKIKAYVLPPIYLGTDKERVVAGKKFIGMNSRFSKELQGSVYYLKPELLLLMIQGLIDNLVKQGFTKIYIVTGHAGSKQVEVLEEIEKNNKTVTFLNPYGQLKFHVEHADEYESSLFWACYPEHEAISRKIKIKNDDDYIKFVGYDPREKASLKLGNKILKGMISTLNKKIK
ncbi:MAG: creatininase family protein [Candidatus Moranbacteria bacterium]|nr:creatininase family protein [Candidatus Moranbacteria bacterium]